jgi:hypothetical protein
MSKFKVIALAATLIMATTGLAIACDKTASTASAETASAEGCASAATAQTASAAGCASAATAQTAGAGCASSATAQTAGAGCASGANVSAQTVQLETVRMPSGAMAVFYNGTDAETVAFLQSKANEGCSGFVCDMAKGMAADENVTTEIAATDTGVMILVTPKSDVASVDKYEEQYAVVVASMGETEGE